MEWILGVSTGDEKGRGRRIMEKSYYLGRPIVIKVYWNKIRRLVEEEKVILVNEHNMPIGTLEKLEAHRTGVLHRAFSIYILNEKNELLLQRRAFEKYHSGGLWTNACCGHPRPEEGNQEAAIRRLNEEMGIEVSLKEIFKFSYKASLDNGLTENEYLHVFVGKYSGEPNPNKAEAADWRWQEVESILVDFDERPADYTEWFKITLPILFAVYNFK